MNQIASSEQETLPTQSATDAYALHEVLIERYLVEIRQWLGKHSLRIQSRGEPDWGDVGDLMYFAEHLRELADKLRQSQFVGAEPYR